MQLDEADQRLINEMLRHNDEVGGENRKGQPT